MGICNLFFSSHTLKLQELMKHSKNYWVNNKVPKKKGWLHYFSFPGIILSYLERQFTFLQKYLTLKIGTF